MAYPYDEEDRRSALTQGLLAAGLAALGARKGSEYNALGQAGLLGITGYNTSLRDATNAREQQAALKMRQEMYDMQKAQWEEQQRQARAQQAAAAGAFTGGMPEMGPPTSQGEMQPAVAPQYNPQAYIAALQANGLPQQAIAEAQKLKPKEKELSRVEDLTLNGKPVTVAFYKDGSREILPYDPKATEQWEDIPTPKGAAPGLQWQRSKLTGQLRSTGSQPAQTTINLGGPKWESSAGGFVLAPSAENPTGKVVVPEGMPKKENKPPVEYQKQVSGMTNLNTAVQEYVDELKNWGITSIASPSAVASMGTKYNNMMLQAKEAYNLGVLNGPDYMILQQVVTNPATLKGTITSNEALGAQAVELARIMKKNAANLAKVHGQPEPAVSAGGSSATSDPRASGGAIGGTQSQPAGKSYKSATMPKLGDLPEGAEVIDDRTGITLVKRNGKWEKK